MSGHGAAGGRTAFRWPPTPRTTVLSRLRPGFPWYGAIQAQVAEVRGRLIESVEPLEHLPDQVTRWSPDVLVLPAGDLQYFVRMLPGPQRDFDPPATVVSVGERLDTLTCQEATRTFGRPPIQVWIEPGDGRPLCALEDDGSVAEGPPTMWGYLVEPLKVRLAPAHPGREDGPREVIVTDDLAGTECRTGHVGELLPGGGLRIGDHIDDLVELEGELTEPAAIERALRRHPNVSEAAVAKCANGTVTAYLVKRPGIAATADHLWSEIVDLVTETPLPATRQFVNLLPRGRDGRLRRRSLGQDNQKEHHGPRRPSAY